MSDSECPPHIRAELISNCQRTKCRNSAFTPATPTDWRPTTVIDPRDPDGRTFTDLTAWDYVVYLLEAGVEIEIIVLTKPSGKRGYVLKIPTANGEIYIKLQLAPPGVKGRSFHYSER